MTSALRTRIENRLTPSGPAELSDWDLRHSPALRLAENIDTGTVPVIASRRPVAAKPSMADPVPYNADKFGKLPRLLPTRRALPPFLAVIPVALVVGCVGAFAYVVGAP